MIGLNQSLSTVNRCIDALAIFELCGYNERRENKMWWIVGILLVLWIVGLSLHFLRWLIHVLLVVALVLVVVRLIQGRKIF